MGFDPGLFHLFIHLPLLWCVRLVDWICRLLHLPSPIYGSRGPQHQGCHLVEVIWRSKLHLTNLSDLDDYMVLHKEWVSPNYILDQANVTLHGVSRSHVWFCVSKPHIDVYSNNFPFVFISQHLMADKLVVMPIEYFHQLADKLGDPTVPVTLLNNMGRCGSTLICQMLSNIQRIRVMSEPWALLNLQERFSRGQFSQDGYRRLLVSLLRMQCKKEKGSEFDHILLKPPYCCLPQIADIRSHLPQIRHIFLLRQPLAAIRSLMKAHEAIFGQVSIFKLLCYRNPFIFYSNPILPKMFENKSPVTMAQMSSASQLATIKAAREFEKGGPFLKIFTYEDLVKDKEVVAELMDIFNMSDNERDEAIKSIEKDSQENSPISHKILKKIKVDETGWEDFEDITKYFQMPNLNSDVEMFRKYIGSTEGI